MKSCIQNLNLGGNYQRIMLKISIKYYFEWAVSVKLLYYYNYEYVDKITLLSELFKVELILTTLHTV